MGNTSCLNGLVIRSLLHEMEKREREEDEPKQCPLKKVVFTYYDYDGDDIFEANERLNTGDVEKEKRYFDERILRDEDQEDNKSHPWRKRLEVKHNKIGSGYKVRIE